MNTITKYTITAVVMIFSMVAYANKPFKLKEDKDLTKYSIKRIDIHLNFVLGEGKSNSNEESWMLGMFNIHEQGPCRNINCSTQHDLVYDPVMKIKVFRGELKR